MDQRKKTFITIVTTAAVTFGITATIFSVTETSGSGFGKADYSRSSTQLIHI